MEINERDREVLDDVLGGWLSAGLPLRGSLSYQDVINAMLKLGVADAQTRIAEVLPHGSPTPRKSGYRGVTWDAGRLHWRTVFSDNGVWKHIGYFDDEVQAAFAHDIEAKRRGQGPEKLNFPRGLDENGRPR